MRTAKHSHLLTDVVLMCTTLLLTLALMMAIMAAPIASAQSEASISVSVHVTDGEGFDIPCVVNDGEVRVGDAPISVQVRVEGQATTIWSGGVTVADSTIVDDTGSSHYLPDPTALGALDEASQAGGFSYVVKDFSSGLAITAVDGIGDWENGP